MAYLDLAAHFGTAPGHYSTAAATTGSAAQDAAAAFSPREWQIVDIARADGLSSLREEGELTEFLRYVFGFERKRPLANPRLEALRRMAVMSWHHGYNVAGSELAAFVEAGFSIDQYDALLAHIGRERAATFRKNRFWGAR